jgi:hypothetical protein
MQSLTPTNFQNFSQEWKKGGIRPVRKGSEIKLWFGLLLNLLVCNHESELKKGSFLELEVKGDMELSVREKE